MRNFYFTSLSFLFFSLFFSSSTYGQIDAVPDSFNIFLHPDMPNEYIINVLINDSLNGVPIQPFQFELTSENTPFLAIEGNGFLYIAAGIPDGTYSICYTICENGVNPANCDSTCATLSVTNFVLNTVVNNFNTLNYSPNPTKDTLTISNASTIDSIEVTSTLGQKILSQKVNGLEANINLSEITNGVYFVKITSERQEKIIKIIKE